MQMEENGTESGTAEAGGWGGGGENDNDPSARNLRHATPSAWQAALTTAGSSAAGARKRGEPGGDPGGEPGNGAVCAPGAPGNAMRALLSPRLTQRAPTNTEPLP